MPGYRSRRTCRRELADALVAVTGRPPYKRSALTMSGDALSGASGQPPEPAGLNVPVFRS
jgi:hypothetical protein